MIDKILIKHIIYLNNMINKLFILLVGKTMFSPATDEPVKS